MMTKEREKQSLGSLALVGPGAIGLYYGGLLADSGQSLRVLARSDAVVLGQNGIRIKRVSPKSGEVLAEQTIRPESVEREAREIGEVDCVLIAAKATVNEALIAPLRELVRSGHTTLITLQNGMGNAEFFARHFPENPVLSGLCFVCANRVASGIVENYHPGRVEIGSLDDRWPELAAAAVEAFTAAGIKTFFAPSLEAALWRKLCWNVPFNGLAIAGGSLTCDRILGDWKLARRARALMEEIRTAAGEAGYPIEADFLDGQFTVTEKMGAYQPSSLIDFVEDRPVEVEAIWGEPLRRGEQLGVPMPELRKIHSEIKQAVAQRG